MTLVIYIVLALAYNGKTLSLFFMNQSRAAGECICVQKVQKTIFANPKEFCCSRQVFLHN
jgi:hypothetical protein